MAMNSKKPISPIIVACTKRVDKRLETISGGPCSQFAVHGTVDERLPGGSHGALIDGFVDGCLGGVLGLPRTLVNPGPHRAISLPPGFMAIGPQQSSPGLSLAKNTRGFGLGRIGLSGGRSTRGGTPHFDHRINPNTSSAVLCSGRLAIGEGLPQGIRQPIPSQN